jgi:hypothetical protein
LMWGALSNEKSGSVVFSFCWAPPFSGLSPMGLMGIFYFLYFLDFSNLEGQVTVFITYRNRLAKLYTRALGLCN